MSAKFKSAPGDLNISTRGMEGNGLKCSCVAEHVGDLGQVLRKQVFKSAILDLGRNEVEDVVLLLSHSGGKLGPYTIREHKIHKRFAKEGKATIRLITQKLHLLISNSPPDQLNLFLRSMVVKVTAMGKTQGSHRRMLGDVSVQFDEISPLTERDVELARRNSTHTTATTNATSKGHVTPGRATAGSESKFGGKENLTTPRRVEVCGTKATKRKLSEVNTENSDENPSKKKSVVLKCTSGLPLSAEQTKVLQMVKAGESVFFTGSAGTGKSYLLKKIINSLPPDTTFATASTGAAASLIGGTTLHAFAGIGTGNGTLEHCISLASRESRAVTWRKCSCLVIDEISMIDAEFFDKLEAVARSVRRNRTPFGGIQLVLCGDFCQLPPVSKEGERKQYCFKAHSWHKCITRSMELTEIYRQNDKQFIAILQNIRIGRCLPSLTKLLQSTSRQEIERDGIRATRLFTHKEDVAATNRRELEALAGERRRFTAQDSDPHMSGTMDNLCPVSKVIELKIGAQVMLTKNTDIYRGLVNGARGVVKNFDSNKGYPVVHFSSGLEVTVGVEKYTAKTGGGLLLTRRQIPLQLAWAVSIHKSQGMTLDCVEMSLGRCFEAGQAYVALSRAKSLKSLRVLDFDPACVRTHPDVLEFYRALRRTRRNYIEDTGLD